MGIAGVEEKFYLCSRITDCIENYVTQIFTDDDVTRNDFIPGFGAGRADSGPEAG
jgi:hypothetical protein